MPDEVRSLSVDEIKALAKAFKEDLAGETDRAVRRKNLDEALSAVVAKDYIDKFVYSLELAAGSRLHELMRPPRARQIRINPHIISKSK